jgi:hypothetical protein
MVDAGCWLPTGLWTAVRSVRVYRLIGLLPTQPKGPQVILPLAGA